MSKQLVLPPFYRDMNFQKADKGIIAHDVINDMYSRLLRLVSANKVNNNFGGLGFANNITNYNIQTVLNEIHQYCIGKVAGKNGLFRNTLMGKNVDYAGRAVISATKIDQETYKEMPIDIDQSGLPIMQCINLFFPFIQRWLMIFFNNLFKQSDYIFDINNHPIRLHPDFMDEYSALKLEKQE